MLALSLFLALYLKAIGRSTSILTVLNILGVTFFLPFVLVQPIDLLIIFLAGWKMAPVAVIHTAVLLWESWAATAVISGIYGLKVHEKAISILILMALWVLITGALWR